MAESLSHKFGQIIGDLLELALEPHLRTFANEHELFLDKKGKRLARAGVKVTWIDGNNNKHDLDFVLERKGSATLVGTPVAFIESAWRRYTKHSRNKAQEIQSAILPLVAKYQSASPFIGVVLAGVFTEGAITQLKSNGFNVLYFPYETVIKAFAKFGIDATFDERTPESDFRSKITQWNALSENNKADIAKELLALNQEGVNDFFSALARSITRLIEKIIILPLHGEEAVVTNASDAINFLNQYTQINQSKPFHKYEIIIRYNIGDKIEASFRDKQDAIKFLQAYL